MNYWTNSNYVWNGKPIQQIGFNLNAPGDRISSSNTLWIDFPNVGGTESEIPVIIDTTNISLIRKEPLSVTSEETPWVIASAIEGIKTIEIQLTKEQLTQENKYKVNLYFAELNEKNKGERIFNVKIQDKPVIENLDIVGETGQHDKELIKSITGVTASNSMKIELVPVKGNTILSGVELIMEN